jgi:predicted ATPase/DNA-binding SARP family transcriptional activator
MCGRYRAHVGIRVSIIDVIGVENNGHSVPQAAIAGRRVRLVLAALATAPAGLSSLALAARVWDEPPATWGAALRGTILVLRSALEPIGLGGQNLIRTTRDGWMLAPGVIVDLAEAESAVEEAESAIVERDSEAAHSKVALSLPLLRGDILSAEDAGWVALLRSRLVRATDRMLVVGAEAALATGRTAAAVSFARELTDRNTLDEGSHRLLIRSLAAAGDRAAAIGAFDSCRTTLRDQLGIDPDPETTAVYLEVLHSGPAGGDGLPEPPHNGFFGRDGELGRVIASLDRPGIVSLIGRGGIGKSRLAAHASHLVARRFPGAVFWATLGDLRDSGVVSVAIARAVGADENAEPVTAAISRLAPLGTALVVLDGVEDVADGVAETLMQLIPAAVELTVLVTSRRPLNLPDERRIELGPLPVPAPDDPEFGDCAAVQLLKDRLSARGRDLALGDSSTVPVHDLLVRCGGVPLALELAAAQLDSMAVADLLDALPQAAGDAEDMVTALISQSYESLGDEQALLFRLFGIVDGVLPLSLATGIVSGAAAPRVARLFTELAERGLVNIDRSGTRWRYRQEDQIRDFARSRLTASEATSALSGLVRAVRHTLPEDPREQPAAYREQITEASDALRTLFTAAIGGRVPREDGLELAFRLHRYWATTGLAEGRYWLGRLLDGSAESQWKPFATFAAGYLGYWAGDVEAAQSLLIAAADGLRGVDDGFAARSLLFAAGIADDRDQPDRALDDVRVAVRLAEQSGDADILVSTSSATASILGERGDPEAVSYADIALDICRGRAGSDQLLAMLATTAMVAWQVGDINRARAAILEADPLFHGEPRIARQILAIATAGVAFDAGEFERAAHFAELAITDGEALGAERELPLSFSLRCRSLLAQGRLAESAAAAIRALETAKQLEYRYPTAIGLDSAFLVLGAGSGVQGLGSLLATARDIRLAGRRQAPLSLRLVMTDSAEPLPVETAISRALDALAPLC